ncbi:MAG: sulfurtransferase [Candidatus Obscuribacterales bacterium]|nr:sulfurtransferase [Candidatus Obscuribacterales bacterium]
MNFASGVKEISAKALQERIKTNPDLLLLDVREANELAVCKLSNIKHIPLGELPARVNELSNKDSEIVVYCRSGKRSERACQFLTASGYKDVANLDGGILAWAKDIDPSMPNY